MNSALQDVLQSVKAFDSTQGFNNRNHLGLRTFGELYGLIQLWNKSVKCRFDTCEIYYGFVQNLEPNTIFVKPGALKKAEEVRSKIASIRYNGRDDFFLGINFAMDGYLASLSSTLDSLAQIANAVAYSRPIDDVSFRKLAMDCNGRKNSFEALIADNYYFPGNSNLSVDTWTNGFKKMRNKGIHVNTFFPSIGSLQLANPDQPAEYPQCEITIDPTFFTGLPSTAQHDMRTYTKLLHSKAEEFVKDALKELGVWLSAQHSQGLSIPTH